MQTIKSQKCQKQYTIENDILKAPEILTDIISWNIGEILLNAFDKNPDHISQIDAATNEKTTYAEMKNRSVRCALWLEKQGLKHDDVVSIWTDSHMNAYIPVFANYLAQIILNPWPADNSLDEICEQLRLFAPKIIFIQANYVDLLEKALKLEKYEAKIVVFGERHSKYQTLLDVMQSQSCNDVDNYRSRTFKNPDEVALLIRTSGSTGPPKAVMLSAEALLEVSFHFRHKNVLFYGSPGRARYNAWLLNFIIHNATRIISLSQDPRDMCSVIDKFQVNSLIGGSNIADLFSSFKELEEYNLQSLQIIQTSSTKINKTTFDNLKASRLHDRFYQRYGASEIGTARVMHRIGDIYESQHSIGFLSPNLQLKIIDRSTKKTLGTNELGEIVIKSPKKILGYYKNPEATAKVLDAEGWYYTGDVGYYDENGEIFIMGRLSDAFVYRGQEFFSSEIEDILWQHPAVENAVVVSVPHEFDGAQPVAFVKIHSGNELTDGELVGLLTTSAKLRTLTLRIKIVNDIPKSSTGKVLKGVLKTLALTLDTEH